MIDDSGRSDETEEIMNIIEDIMKIVEDNEDQEPQVKKYVYIDQIGRNSILIQLSFDK